MKLKRHYFSCSCQHPEHQLIVTYDNELWADGTLDELVYLDIGLRRPYNFFTRLITAIKYLLNIETDHYHFEVMLDSHDQRYLIEILQEKQTQLQEYETNHHP